MQPGANEYLVKYFGCVEVELGTGIETVQNSVEVSCSDFYSYFYVILLLINYLHVFWGVSIIHSDIKCTCLLFKKLSGGAMMVGYLEVTKGGVTLCDSQRTALSRRVIDLDTVSYCGITR